MTSAEQKSMPIAEHFHSVQGEGYWVGTPMHFIRLAGCPVGRLATTAFQSPEDLPILSNGNKASMCRTYDGRFFVCDTDFSIKERMSVADLINETHERHICLTGGEPLSYAATLWWHDLRMATLEKNVRIHIETSGTIDRIIPPDMWVTVAPKYNVLPKMLARADEIKFLVDEDFDFAKLPDFDDVSDRPIWLCPINDEKEVLQENVDLCLRLLAQRPHWRLSAQWHKFIGVR